MPGDHLTCKIKLNFPLPVATGLRFALREGGKTIAAGVISNVLPDDPEDDKKGVDAKKAGKPPAGGSSGKPAAGGAKSATG